MDRPTVVLRSGDRVRTLANRNTLVGAVPWVNGVKTGHTLSGRVVPRRLGAAGRRRARQRRAGDAERGRAQRRHARRCCAGASPATPASRRRARRPSVARLPVTDQDRKVVRRPRAHGARGRAPRRASARPRDRAARGDRGPGRPAGTRVGQLVVTVRGRAVDRVPLVTATAVARASVWQRTSRAARAAGRGPRRSGRPSPEPLASRQAAVALDAAVAGPGARPRDHHRHPQRGHRQDRCRCRTSGSGAATGRSTSARCRAARASTSRAASRRSGGP